MFLGYNFFAEHIDQQPDASYKQNKTDYVCSDIACVGYVSYQVWYVSWTDKN